MNADRTAAFADEYVAPLTLPDDRPTVEDLPSAEPPRSLLAPLADLMDTNPMAVVVGLAAVAGIAVASGIIVHARRREVSGLARLLLRFGIAR